MAHTQTQGGNRRRLSDSIEDAFNKACRQGQAEVAACMLKGLDLCLLGQPTSWERRQAAMSLLRSCAEQLSLLRDVQADTGPGLAGSRPPAGENAQRVEAEHTVV